MGLFSRRKRQEPEEIEGLDALDRDSPAPDDAPEDEGAADDALPEDEPEVAAALRTLAEAGAAETEEIGEEIGSLPTAVSWVERKIALLIEPEGTNADAEGRLLSDGWVLLHPDTLSATTIPAALLGKE